MARYGIVVDLNRCTGCITCVVACKEENLTRPSVWWDKILEIENPSLDHITYLWHACMHCDNPPCVGACPAKAISKRQDGIVLIDQKVCNGCGDCIKACPYGVIAMNPTQNYFQGKRCPTKRQRMPTGYRYLKRRRNARSVCIGSNKGRNRSVSRDVHPKPRPSAISMTLQVPFERNSSNRFNCFHRKGPIRKFLTSFLRIY